MDYPFDRPIRNHFEATLAAQSAYWWPAHTLEAIHPIGDRLIEIVAFRAEKLWQDTQADTVLGVLTVESVLITLRHDPMLLAPVPSFSNFFPGGLKEPASSRWVPRFYDEASCLNLLGSMQMAELFRRTMCHRFGRPIGTSELNHTSSPWPTLPLWQGPERVLDRLMTHDHCVRREAGLLELATDPAPHPPGQRRL